MLYAAKCYWPGVTATELKPIAARTARGDSRSAPDDTAHLGALLCPDDSLVPCLFEGPSRAAVKHTSERAGLPGERIMDSIWLAPDRSTPKGPQS